MYLLNVKTNDFKNVRRLYPNGVIKGIKEHYTEGQGWYKASNIINIPSSDFMQTLNHFKNVGIKSLKLVIVDEFGLIKEPDYNVSELI